MTLKSHFWLSPLSFLCSILCNIYLRMLKPKQNWKFNSIFQLRKKKTISDILLIWLILNSLIFCVFSSKLILFAFLAFFLYFRIIWGKNNKITDKTITIIISEIETQKMNNIKRSQNNKISKNLSFSPNRKLKSSFHFCLVLSNYNQMLHNIPHWKYNWDN